MASIVTSDLVPLRNRGVYQVSFSDLFVSPFCLVLIETLAIQGLGNVVYAFGAAIGGPLVS